jgi:hypothetical protein
MCTVPRRLYLMSPVLELPKRRLLLACLDTPQRINYCHHKPPIIFPSGGEEAARKGVEGSDFEAVVFTDACRRSEDFGEARGQDLYALPELQNGDDGRNDGEEDGRCFFGFIEP